MDRRVSWTTRRGRRCLTQHTSARDRPRRRGSTSVFRASVLSGPRAIRPPTALPRPPRATFVSPRHGSRLSPPHELMGARPTGFGCADRATRKELIVTTWLRVNGTLELASSQIVYVSPEDGHLYWPDTFPSTEWQSAEARARGRRRLLNEG